MPGFTVPVCGRHHQGWFYQGRAVAPQPFIEPFKNVIVMMHSRSHVANLYFKNTLLFCLIKTVTSQQ